MPASGNALAMQQSVTADSSLLTSTSAVQQMLKQHQQQRNGSGLGLTGREALLNTEPDDDMACSDMECCKERKSKFEEERKEGRTNEA